MPRAGVARPQFLLALIAVTSILAAVSDEDEGAKRTLEKLRKASHSLKSAHRASRETVREVDRATRAVTQARKQMLIEHPRTRSRKRR